MDYDKIKIHAIKAKVDSIDMMAELEAAEKEKMADKVNKILAYCLVLGPYGTVEKKVYSCTTLKINSLPTGLSWGFTS